MTISSGSHTLRAWVTAAVFDATRLAVFREVVRRGSLSAAAQALNFTQPAVSRQIAALEREADAQLLERTPRGIRLTEPGRVLLGHAEAILDRMSAAHAQIESVARMAGGRLRIGAFQTATATVVARAIAAFAARAPERRALPRRGGHARRRRGACGRARSTSPSSRTSPTSTAPTSRWSTSSTTSCSSPCPRRTASPTSRACACATCATRPGSRRRAGARSRRCSPPPRGPTGSSRASASPPSSGCRSRASSPPASGSRSSPASRSRASATTSSCARSARTARAGASSSCSPAGYRAPAVEPFVALLRSEAAEHAAALDERARLLGRRRAGATA